MYARDKLQQVTAAYYYVLTRTSTYALELRMLRNPGLSLTLPLYACVRIYLGDI